MNRLTSDNQMLGYGLMQTYPNISCFSTKRHGGFSQGTYASFNCNGFAGDNPDDVARNRQHLVELLGRGPIELVLPHQTHSDRVAIIDDTYIYKVEEERTALLEGVDALVTDQLDKCLCISTADCIPVLLYDPVRQAIGAAHAGWRGTVMCIVEKTLRVMTECFGTQPVDVRACIGPGISQEAFEVGEEVYEAFAQAGFEMERIACRKGKWHLDLWEANRLQLLQQGVLPAHVEVAGICTYAHNDDFFSARRQGIHSGRILSGICLHA